MSSKLTLTAETGRPTGSGASNRLRAEGKIPGVVYGHGMTPVPVTVDRRELRHVLTGPAGFNAVVHLTFDGQTHPTVIKDHQRDALKRNVSHIDFQVVSMTEAISLDVPVVLQGEPKAVESEGGIVEQLLTALTINTTPASIPAELPVDVSGLQIGDVIRVGDLALPAGVTTDVDPETAVVVGAHAQKDTAEAPEVTEGDEGDEAAESDEA